MAWFYGTATDQWDFLDQLSQLGSGEHISATEIYDGGSGYIVGETLTPTTGSYDHSPELEVTSTSGGDTLATVASIVAGGTGYAVGDTLYVDDGTYLVQGILEVTSESGGAVTGLQINNPGIYSVQPAGTLTTTKITGSGNDDLTVTVTWNTSVTGIAIVVFISDAGASTSTPTDPISFTASDSGTGFKANLTWTETAWETLMNVEPQILSSAVVAAGGTGYAVDDLLTVVEGAGTAIDHAVVKVATVSGTAVLTVTVEDSGYYEVVPGNPVDTSTAGGGSGCTLTGTWSSFSILVQFLILHNTVEDVYQGFAAWWYSTTDADILDLDGHTGYNSSLRYSDQPGTEVSECYVPLHDSTFSYYVSMVNRRITAVFNVGSGTTWPNFYAGLLDPFMTADEYPYPQLTMGCISAKQKYTYSAIYGGMHNPGSQEVGDNGPGRMRMPDGSMDVLRNWTGTSTPSIRNAGPSVQPIGHQYTTPSGGANAWYDADADRSWNKVVRASNIDDSDQDDIKRLNDDYILIPCIVSDVDNSRLLGTMTGVFWFDNHEANLLSGDRIWVGATAYRVFKNCALSNKNNYFAILEG